MTASRLAICGGVLGVLCACTGLDTSPVGDGGTSPGSQSPRSRSVDWGAASTAAEVGPQEVSQADSPARAVPHWLAAAVDHGVTPPTGGGTTYHVDPFVAALVLEQARAGELAVTRISEPGGATGYRLDNVDPNGLLGRLGLATGDVVQAFNGTTVQDTPALVPALAESQNRLMVQLERGGYSMTLEYRLVGGMAWSRALGSPGGGDPSAEPGLGPRAALLDAPEPANTTQDLPGSGPSIPPLGAPTKPSANPVPKPSGKPPGTGSSSAGVRCPSSTQCEIDGATFDGLVNNPARLEAQATIVPAISNDIQSGYKLKTVKPGSDLWALGFRGGDKITHINGHFLGDDSQATALYFKLPATRVFNVRFERGGKQLTKRVQVR